MTTLTRAHYEEAAAFVRDRITQKPGIGLVLGSGLGELADEIQGGSRFACREIPHWPVSTVEGHAGEIVIGELQGKTVLVLRGRLHYYEGYSMSQITLPIRVMQLLNVHTLILTNAAGGMAPEMKAGDLMLITDHINLTGMAGHNPLRGPNDDRLGPRFPDMTQPYDPELRTIAAKVARQTGIPLREGVYVSLAGPSFETPAELRFLRMIGADAVGMSTAPEVVIARHAGLRVLAISGISNLVRMEADPHTKTTHQEVLETGKIIVPRLLALLRGVLQELPATT
jgi:purine-nucleoside phosphorylase